MANATFSPLLWPEGVERAAAPTKSLSRTRVRTGITDTLTALDLLGDMTSTRASNVVLTFDEEARRGACEDHGVAAWFVWNDQQHCITCDLYATQGANLSVIAQIIRSCTAEHARGGIAAVGHALATYAIRMSTPTSGMIDGHWSRTLGVNHDASQAEITAAFRRRALETHPDKGGTRKQWDQVAEAFEQARQRPEVLARADDDWSVPTATDEAIVWSHLFPDAGPGTTSD